MASLDPSAQEIANVCDFTGLDPFEDRDLVTQALKNNNRNVESVVTQYFDNGEAFKKKYQKAWDDSLFGADRDGADNHAAICSYLLRIQSNSKADNVAFHIESPSQNEVINGVAPTPGFGAPSRPPSRSNNISPLGRTVDWVAQSATGNSISFKASGDGLTNAAGAPNNPNDEDEDLQRALRESAQEAGVDGPMETGVMYGPSYSPTTAPVFGPAKRDDYDQGDWAMVPVGPAAETRFNRAPAPSTRKRADGAPAFLVQGVSSPENRLGGLLTILHEIPLARNILVQSGSPAASYGHNSEWWKGQEILPPHVLAQMQSGDLQWGGQERYKPDFDEETHRLMAFLDSTERSYGTVSVLTDLIPFSNIGAEKQFYEQLGNNNGDRIRPLMNIASLAEVQGDEDGFEEAKFGLLEMDHLRSDYSEIKTLYESLDHVMWNDVLSWNELHEGSKMAMFKEMGEVFVIKIGSDGPEESFEIPEVLYPERYLKSRKEEARQIQKAWCSSKIAMIKAMESDVKAYQWTDPTTGKVHDARELIGKATEQWNGYNEYLEGLARFHTMEQSGFQTDRYPDYRAAPCEMNEEAKEQSKTVQEVVQFCEHSLANLQKRSAELQSTMDQIKAKQRFLGRLLTVLDKPGRPKPFTCNKYLLRGVATSKDVVYVCQRAEADLIELEDEAKPTDQWWRLAYVPDDEQPVKTEKVEIERVFRDLWQETKTPLLVYATENALQTPRAALSPALQRFMKAENKAFRQELNQEKAEAREKSGNDAHEKRKPGILDPLSPSKRKHRSDSIDSMDSNRASLGSEDEIIASNPFADQDDSGGTELTEISGNPNFARSASVESSGIVNNQALLQPTRNPTSPEDTSATMTPSTIQAETEDIDNSRIIKTEVVEIKSPEMRERARPPSFIAMSRTSSEQKQPPSLMDMDIPEVHE
ncbi:Fc.00g049680.m01.CDS01 [Cosmosporella sp. VM-42]